MIQISQPNPGTDRTSYQVRDKENQKAGKAQTEAEDKSTSLNQSAVVNDNIKAAVQERKEEDKQKDETTIPQQIGGIVWALVALNVVIIVGISLLNGKGKEDNMK